MDDLWARVRDRWKREGLSVREPADEAQLAECERRLGRALPSDLRGWFAAVGGMEAHVYDSEFLRFWTIEEVTFASDHGIDDGEPSLLFADFMIWSHAYGIRCAPPHDVLLVGDSVPLHVCNGFRDFVARYLEQPISLFGLPIR